MTFPLELRQSVSLVVSQCQMEIRAVSQQRKCQVSAKMLLGCKRFLNARDLFPPFSPKTFLKRSKSGTSECVTVFSLYLDKTRARALHIEISDSHYNKHRIHYI